MITRLVRTAGFLATATTLLLGSAMATPAGPPRLIQPTSYASASGIWVLEVDPTSKYGEGPGRYRMTKDGVEVWRYTLQFTLQEAAVTDDGVTVGYAYTEGREGRRATGDLVVGVISAEGRVVAQHATRRTPGRAPDTLPDPMARAMVFDPEHDRFMVRVVVADHNRGAEEWWFFRISTGDWCGRFRPVESMAQPEGVWWRLLGVLPLSGTPLLVVHWRRYESRGLLSTPRVGGRFAITDVRGRELWATEWPEDYVVEGDRDASRELERRVEDGRALLGTGPGGEFSFWLARWRMKITCRLVPASDPSGWRVEAVSREPFDLPPVPRPERPRIAVRDVELTELGSAILEGVPSNDDGGADGTPDPEADRTELHRPGAVLFDALDRIVVHDWHTGGLHVFDAEGTHMFVAVPSSQDAEVWTKVQHLASGRDGDVYMQIRDVPDSRYVRFDSRGARAGEGTFSGRKWVFVPGTDQRWIDTWDGVELVDPRQGQLAWIERWPDRQWFQWVHGMAVAPDGSLALSEGPLIGIYGPGGEPRHLHRTAEPAQSLAYSGTWVAASDGWDAVYLIRDADGDVLRVTNLVRGKSPTRFHVGFSADGRELRVLDLESRRLSWYGLPRD